MQPLLQHASSTRSTNDEVAAWIRGGCADGAALRVDEQTGGRGRRGRSWEAPAGRNLTMSIAVVGVRYQPSMLLVPLAAGVGAVDGIARVAGVGAGLKWPNDLVLGTRKLGGILCEAVLDGPRYLGAVVGIGINVNSAAADFAPELRERVSTLADVRGAETDLTDLAAVVRARVMAAVGRLADGDREGILADWSACDTTAGRRVAIDGGAGVALGIDAEGALLVRLDDGTDRAVRAGEVTFEVGDVAS